MVNICTCYRPGKNCLHSSLRIIYYFIVKHEYVFKNTPMLLLILLLLLLKGPLLFEQPSCIFYLLIQLFLFCKKMAKLAKHKHAQNMFFFLVSFLIFHLLLLLFARPRLSFFLLFFLLLCYRYETHRLCWCSFVSRDYLLLVFSLLKLLVLTQQRNISDDSGNLCQQ